MIAVCAMGTHVSFIFRGYNPYMGGVKPWFFMVLGSKGVEWLDGVFCGSLVVVFMFW